jgi:hypothetical protein
MIIIDECDIVDIVDIDDNHSERIYTSSFFTRRSYTRSLIIFLFDHGPCGWLIIVEHECSAYRDTYN